MTTQIQSTRFDHEMLDSKTLCKQFLQEFGVARDWARCTVGEMRGMLKAYPDDKLYGAARKIIERDGEVFDQADWEVVSYDVDGNTVEAGQTVQVVDQSDEDDKLEAELAKPVIQAPRPPAVPAAQWPTPPVTPKVSQAPKPVASGPAEALAQALAAMMAGQQTSVDPAQVAAIANTVFDSKALTLADTMRSTLQAIVDEAIKGVKPREIVVKIEKKEVTIDGLQHMNFEKLLRVCSARMSDDHRLNAWVYGPPGTGKTTAARKVAEAIGLKFYTTGAILTKYDITGFIAAQGNLIRSDFREAWEHGGIFLLDEIDGSDPRAIVAFNAALANGIMAFPDGMIERHKDCVMIAAANTSGMGATAEFSGRMKMDMASMDRFIMVDWPIDEAIEAARSTNPAWLKVVQKVRANVAAKGIKGVCVTPRATIFGCALLEAGLSMDDVKKMVLRKSMSVEQWAMVAA